MTDCRLVRCAISLGRMLGLALAIAAIPMPAFADGQEDWVLQSPATKPSPRVYAAMTYDSANQKLVLFGGSPNGGPNDTTTWLWDGTNWTANAPVPSPTAREGHAMAYDAAHNQVVLFGGQSLSDGSLLQDTWVWSGNTKTWTQLAPAASPAARWGHSMAYDGAHGQIVLFGGGTDSAEVNDTWTWDGTTWTPLNPAASPAIRELHKMVYDAARGEIVLFGGHLNFGGQSAFYSDTWTWNGTTWTQKSPATVPPDRYNHAMAYEASQSRVVMFGGVENQNADCGADTWAWNGTNWAQLLPATVPDCLEANPMEYDAAVSHLVMFGTIGNSVLNDTWYFGTTSTTAVTITVPAGLQFNFNGTSYTGPQALNLAPGVYTLATPAAQPTGVGTQAAFVSWSDGGAASHPVTVGTTALAITGTYKTQFLLTTAGSPAAGGATVPGTGYFDQGSVVGVTPAPSLGYAFSSWSGDCSGNGACSVTMSAPMSVTANYTQVAVPVTVNVPAGRTFTLNGTLYTGAQTILFAPNSGPYTLTTASPQVTGAGSQAVFVSWSDGGAQTHTLSVGTVPQTITGTYKTQYLLTLVASPPNEGTVAPGSGFFDQGSVVTVTAVPNAGFKLGSWSGACAGSGACVVTMSTPQTVTANFTTILIPVTINVPAGISFVFLGRTYVGPQTFFFPFNAGPYPLSTLSPQATGVGTQAVFVAWSDGGAQAHPIVVGTVPITVTGTFKYQYLLTAVANPAVEGSVTTGPGPSAPYYDAGSVVVALATANNGFTLNYWSGGCTGSSPFCFVTMNAPQTVTANFGVPESWNFLFGPSMPPARTGHAMAWDAAFTRRNIVMFGGIDQTPAEHLLNDTWVFNGVSWVQQFPMNRPSVRAGATMAYDFNRKQVILFGGWNTPSGTALGGGTASWLNDTWAWSGSNWIPLNPATKPPARGEHVMAQDARNQVMIFGGRYLLPSGVTVLLSDTWVWNGVNWIAQNPQPHPSARVMAGMAYDGARQQTVLFGGDDGISPLPLSDTWTWDGTSWTHKFPNTVPQGVEAFAMAFDGSLQATFVVGGITNRLGGSTSLMWVWDGTDWTAGRYTNTSPFPFAQAVMAYDALRAQLVMFGGNLVGLAGPRTYLFK